MAVTAYWHNCIREIRHSVYGRDNRKPIADAIEQVDTVVDEYIAILKKHFDKCMVSVSADPLSTWYTYDYDHIEIVDLENQDGKLAKVVTNEITVNLLSGDNYLLKDSIPGDSTTWTAESTYRANIQNSVTETHVHHGEDYKIVIGTYIDS